MHNGLWEHAIVFNFMATAWGGARRVVEEVRICSFLKDHLGMVVFNEGSAPPGHPTICPKSDQTHSSSLCCFFGGRFSCHKSDKSSSTKTQSQIHHLFITHFIIIFFRFGHLPIQKLLHVTGRSIKPLISSSTFEPFLGSSPTHFFPKPAVLENKKRLKISSAWKIPKKELK